MPIPNIRIMSPTNDVSSDPSTSDSSSTSGASGYDASGSSDVGIIAGVPRQIPVVRVEQEHIRQRYQDASDSESDRCLHKRRHKMIGINTELSFSSGSECDKPTKKRFPNIQPLQSFMQYSTTDTSSEFEPQQSAGSGKHEVVSFQQVHVLAGTS